MLVDGVLLLITQPTTTHINNNINRTANTISDAIISYIALLGTGFLVRLRQQEWELSQYVLLVQGFFD